MRVKSLKSFLSEVRVNSEVGKRTKLFVENIIMLSRDNENFNNKPSNPWSAREKSVQIISAKRNKIYTVLYTCKISVEIKILY